MLLPEPFDGARSVIGILPPFFSAEGSPVHILALASKLRVGYAYLLPLIIPTKSISLTDTLPLQPNSCMLLIFLAL